MQVAVLRYLLLHVLQIDPTACVHSDELVRCGGIADILEDKKYGY